ncbi:hypothetical protein ACLB2K_054062 [Fragaria x ananassa]
MAFLGFDPGDPNRCLVVLDDIWTLEAWNSIKPGFPINEETGEDSMHHGDLNHPKLANLLQPCLPSSTPPRSSKSTSASPEAGQHRQFPRTQDWRRITKVVKVFVVRSAAAVVIKAGAQNIKHNGNIKLDDVIRTKPRISTALLSQFSHTAQQPGTSVAAFSSFFFQKSILYQMSLFCVYVWCRKREGELDEDDDLNLFPCWFDRRHDSGTRY